MALRRVAFVALLLALAPATSASATTKISLLVDDAATSFAAGVGGGSSGTFVYSGFCQVMRVKPDAGKDTKTPEVYVGNPCGSDAVRQVFTTPTATSGGASVGADSPLA